MEEDLDLAEKIYYTQRYTGGNHKISKREISRSVKISLFVSSNNEFQRVGSKAPVEAGCPRENRGRLLLI